MMFLFIAFFRDRKFLTEIGFLFVGLFVLLLRRVFFSRAETPVLCFVPSRLAVSVLYGYFKNFMWWCSSIVVPLLSFYVHKFWAMFFVFVFFRCPVCQYVWPSVCPSVGDTCKPVLFHCVVVLCFVRAFKCWIFYGFVFFQFRIFSFLSLARQSQMFLFLFEWFCFFLFWVQIFSVVCPFQNFSFGRSLLFRILFLLLLFSFRFVFVKKKDKDLSR